MKYVTSYERFVAGDFPMVCARSGRPATALVRVSTWRSSLWSWFFAGGRGFALSVEKGDPNHPWGRLPLADRRLGRVSATYRPRVGVTLRGVHPDFVAAARQAEGPLP